MTQTNETPMTAERASLLLNRFKYDEKMLGPNEQAAIDFAIASLSAPVAAQAQPDQPQPSGADSDMIDILNAGWRALAAQGIDPETVEMQPIYDAMMAAQPSGNNVPLHTCGGIMSRNPHPDAGKPGHTFTEGTVWECIPCTVKSRHEWAHRAVEAEKALSELVDKITPRLDTGDLLADAATASKALDRAQPSGNALPESATVDKAPECFNDGEAVAWATGWNDCRWSLIDSPKTKPSGNAGELPDPVAWMTHHDEPMVFLSASECAHYCDEGEVPIPLVVGIQAEDYAAARVRAALAAQASGQTQSAICDLIAVYLDIKNGPETLNRKFSLSASRDHGWQAWVTESDTNPDRKINLCGSGPTAEEACRFALLSRAEGQQ